MATDIPLENMTSGTEDRQHCTITDLHKWCKEGNTDAVKCFIPVDQRNFSNHDLFTNNEVYGNTPLHVAVLFGHLDIVEYLSGIDQCVFKKLLSIKNEIKDTPVHHAARCGNVRMLKLMYGADKECFTIDGSLKQTPIHYACGFGHLEAVKYILSKDQKLLESKSIPLEIDPFETTTECPTALETDQLLDKHKDSIKKQASRTETNQTEEDWTPLTFACHFGNKEVVRYLLSVGAKPYPVALQKAIEGGYEECAKLLLLVDDPNQDNYWREILRHYTPDGKTKPTTPFRELIKHMPNVAEVVLHNSTKIDRHFVNNENFTVECQFKYVRDSMETDDSQCCFGLQDLEHPVSLMVKYKRKELLTHPVVSLYIYDQWKFFGWWCSLLNLFLYIFFQAILFTTVTFLLPHPLGADCITSNESEESDNWNTSNLSINTSMDNFNESDNWSTLDMSMNTSTNNLTDNKSSIGTIILALLILIHSLIRLGLEVMQLIQSVIHALKKTAAKDKDCCRCIVRIDYIKSWMNWIEFPLYTLTVVFILTLLVQLANNNPCPLEWQWQIGAFVMLLTWFELIVFFSQFQLVGVYALMFVKVLYTFMKVATLAFLMILAFTMTFHMLLSRPGYTNSPFMTIGRAILKIMVMSTGELNSDSFFRYEDGADISGLPFPAVTVILWLFFFILMTVLLTNMLVGLAVGDITGVYKEAEFEKLSLEVKYILGLEKQLKAILCLANCKCLDNKKDEKTFMPNAKKKIYVEIPELFISFFWGVIRYDSHEGINRVIRYYSKKNKPSRINIIQVQSSHDVDHKKNDGSRMTKAESIDQEGQQTTQESKNSCIIQ